MQKGLISKTLKNEDDKMSFMQLMPKMEKILYKWLLCKLFLYLFSTFPTFVGVQTY